MKAEPYIREPNRCSGCGGLIGGRSSSECSNCGDGQYQRGEKVDWDKQ